MKKYFFSALLLVLSIVTVLGQDPGWKKPVIKQFTLDNGLQVVLNEDHSKPVVFGIIVTKAGSKDDPSDATGMAHYMEHMMFKGTEDMGTIDWNSEKPLIEKIFSLYDELGKTTDPEARLKIQQQINEASVEANKFAIPNEMDKIIKSIGGTDLNANTSNDRTMYFNSFPPSQMEKWLEIYSRRFMNPVFRGFQSELEVVYEEKNLYSDMFQFKLFEEFNKLFFKNHPYGQQPLIGTMEHLKNPSLTKMYECYTTYYVPNNMALIISGDFKAEEIIPMIKEKFGRWQSKELPKPKTWEEKPFNGREFAEMKLSPIKLAILGFQTVPTGHSDEYALKVCNGILSNANQTGLLDKLSLENKLLAAMVFPMAYNDYGQTLYFVIPKIVGQKLEDAEAMVLAEVANVRDGKFEDWMIEAIKYEMYRDFMLEMESPEGRALYIAELIGQNRKPEEIFNVPDQILKVTKEDVIRVAKQYYGENFLAFYSKMGFPKNDKIDKPGFKPVISNTEAKSVFAQELEKIEAAPMRENFVDMRNDLIDNRLFKGINMYVTQNPVNDIFSLTVKFGMGEYYHPLLGYATQLMNYAGTAERDVNELKKEFSKIGCTYSVWSDKNYTWIELTGRESDLPKALALLGELMRGPKADQEKVEIIIEGVKSERKMEKSEPDNVAEALFSYVRYYQESPYIKRPTMKELGKLTADSLLSVFRKALMYEAEIHFVGKTSFEDITGLLKENLPFATKPYVSLAPSAMDVADYEQSTVFLVDKPKALQSKIYFMINAKPFYNDDEPYIDAFNLYFGGDFSGLVMQEVREYRSLAYAAGAAMGIPAKNGRKGIFYGYIGTQADKTIEAIEIFNTLVREMPLKTDRIDFIKEYLVQSAVTSRPGFRDLSQSVAGWKLLGYRHDPSAVKIPVYMELTFQDIAQYYATNIKTKPMVIAIVGNAKKISMEELEKYGTVIKVKEKSLFRD